MPELKVKISADIASAVDGIKAVTDETRKLLREGKTNIAGVNAALRDLKNAAAQAGNSKDLANLNKAIKEVSEEGERLGRIGKEGFDEMGNAASGSFGKIGKGADQAYGVVRKLANILPGLGISGVFLLLGEGVIAAYKSLSGLGTELVTTADRSAKAAKEAQRLHEVLVNLKSSTDVTIEAAGSKEGDLARVRALADAINDTNKSYKERKNALDELRETNKAYFGDLTLESASLKTLADRVNTYSQALINEAVVKGQVEEISKMSIELQKQIKVLGELGDKRDKAIEDIKTGPKEPTAIDKILDVTGITQTVKSYNISNENDEYAKQAMAVELIKNNIKDLTAALSESISKQIDFKPLKDFVPEKAKGDITSLLNEILNVQKALREADSRPLFQRLADSQNDDIAKSIGARAAKAIAEGIKIGTPEAIAAGKRLAELLGVQLERERNPVLKSRVQGIVDVTASQQQEIESKIEKAFGARGLTVEVPTNLAARLKKEGFDKDSIAEITRAYTEQAMNNMKAIEWRPDIQILLDKRILQEQLQRGLVDSINSAVKGAASSGLASIGDSIGKALATGKNPIAEAGKAIVGSIGDLIQQIGKALIQYGLVMEGLQKVVQAGFALPGIAAIAIGVGAVAVGALLKNAFKQKAFAAGGVVTGPTNALIGERGPEAVFPLTKLNEFVAGLQGPQNNVSFAGDFQLRGNDLMLVMQRAQKNQNFVSGR